MPGLDGKIVDEIDWQTANRNIITDLRSDFILSPHFNTIFENNSEKLIEQTSSDLKAGRYNPRLPITFSVLKGQFLTRPGSILEPADRLVYQALVEASLPKIEEQLDRTRAFSQVPSNETDHLFEPSNIGWDNFQESVAQICQENEHVLKADITNYFETIPHHPLINLISSSGVPGEITNLLEELLLSFRQRNSFGIVQGIYPSDVLGNFYLSGFDGDCALHEIPSARYVDDIFAGFKSELEARRNLIRIIEKLRQNGLSFNSSKTSVEPSQNILQEEQEIDLLFNAARDEIKDEVEHLRESGYGFQGDWIDGEDGPSPEDIDLIAVRTLLLHETHSENKIEKIQRFCLPLLRGANDQSAIDISVEGFIERPHLSRLYASYLTHFTRNEPDVVNRLEQLITDDNFFSDYQKMYALSSILNCDEVSAGVVQASLRWLEAADIAHATRAICAIFAAKFGTANQKRMVRLRYEDETSEYVRSAILFAAKFFQIADKRSAKRAWGGQSTINAQICDVI